MVKDIAIGAGGLGIDFSAGELSPTARRNDISVVPRRLIAEMTQLLVTRFGITPRVAYNEHIL